MDADGEVRDGAQVAELTGLLDLTRWPAGMRVIVRREKPHPGAGLTLFEQADGWRYQAFATNTRAGQLAFLEARHRAHARVEDRIRVAKDTGLGRFPSRDYTINQVWIQIAAIAADLTGWLQLIALDDDLAKAEPKTAAVPHAARPRPADPRRPTTSTPPPDRLAVDRPDRRRLRHHPGHPRTHLTGTEPATPDQEPRGDPHRSATRLDAMPRGDETKHSSEQDQQRQESHTS